MSKFTCKLQYTVVYNKKLKPFIEVYYFRLFSSDVFFFTYMYVCSIRINEQVYVFWALCT